MAGSAYQRIRAGGTSFRLWRALWAPRPCAFSGGRSNACPISSRGRCLGCVGGRRDGFPYCQAEAQNGSGLFSSIVGGRRMWFAIRTDWLTDN